MRHGTNLIMTLLASAGTFVGIGIMQPTSETPHGLPGWLNLEAPTIIAAAHRNGVTDAQDIRLMFAIRQAERGRAGLEFGILVPGVNTLELQAAWCACTIRNHHARHEAHACGLEFLECLGNRYCPPDAHPLNKNWLKNVRYFLEK